MAFVTKWVDMYPDVALSRLVNTLKTVSSRLIRRDYKEHQRKVLLPKTCSLDGSILHYFDWWRTIRDIQVNNESLFYQTIASQNSDAQLLLIPAALSQSL